MSLSRDEREQLARLLEKLADEGASKGEERVKLPNGQLARLFFRQSFNFGHEVADISLEIPKGEKITIAADAASMYYQDVKRIPYAVRELRAARAFLDSDNRTYAMWQGARRRCGLEELVWDNFFEALKLVPVERLLLNYRPDFDGLPEQDRVALLMRTAEKVNSFHKSLQEMTAFVEYGDPYEGLPRNTVKNASLYVRAAQIKDFNPNLSEREVGKLLGLRTTETDRKQGGNQLAGKAIKQGRSILKEFWGEDVYEEHIRELRREAKWWLEASTEQKREAYPMDPIELMNSYQKGPIKTLQVVTSGTVDPGMGRPLLWPVYYAKHLKRESRIDH